MAASFIADWHLVSLRPQGRHGSLRAAARRHRGGVLAVSGCRIEALDDPGSRAALDSALACGLAVFTSPAAVDAADALRSLAGVTGLHALAVGAGTADALRRHGVARVTRPSRMDSEGLLGLPVLVDIPGHRLGLVTAPGGRGVLQPALEARGGQVLRANVYARRPVPPSPRAVRALRQLDGPAVVAVSSADALAHVLEGLPTDVAARLRALPAVASSARLAERARQSGFAEVQAADGPRPAQLVGAAIRLLGV